MKKKEKKEKKPKKQKQPKQPKPKKEKKVRAEGEEKKGGKKKLLILIPLLAAALAVVVFVVLPKIRGGSDQPAEDAEQSEQAGQEEEGQEEKGQEDEDGQEEEKEVDPENRDPADDGNDIDEEGAEPMSVSQAVNYMMTLPPSLLGLEGSSMTEYDIYPGGAVVRVDGMACTEMSVYSKSDTAGTNNIVSTYLLSRGEIRHLFKLDKVTKQVTEIPLPDAEPAPEDSGEGDGEDAEDSGEGDGEDAEED